MVATVGIFIANWIYLQCCTYLAMMANNMTPKAQKASITQPAIARYFLENNSITME